MKRTFFSIYALIACTFLVMALAMTATMNGLITGVELEVERFEFRGLYALIIQDLESMPDSAWHGYIDELNATFGYPIEIVANSNIQLPEAFRQDHADGSIVATSDKVDELVKKIPGTAYSLKMGPLPQLKDAGIKVLIGAIGFVALAIPVFAWSLLLWRGLSRMEEAAQAFGKGDLSSRVSGPGLSSLADLKQTFNAMADRIQGLIASHKDLTNAVSHELRTPLSRIRFGMAMVKTGKTQEEQQRFLEGVQRDVEEIETLVGEMLTYARFDRAPGKVAWEAHEVGSWLRCLVASEGEEGVVTLALTAPDAPMKSRFDPQHMSWAVRNLIRNALMHADTEVRVSLQAQKKMVHICVDDDGSGIPEAHRVRIFEPFARLDGSRNRKSGGYGLGLAIVKRIATAHKGTVTVEDSSMGGARFILTWPIIPGS